jgi:hypothetical protein
VLLHVEVAKLLVVSTATALFGPLHIQITQEKRTCQFREV